MQKINQSIDNLSRTNENGLTKSHLDPHADLYATVHKTRSQPATWNQFEQASASPDSWV